jgi:hypothetical protein
MKKRHLIHNLVSIFIPLFLVISFSSSAQETLYNAERSAARNWNEAMLFAIRNDFARPTVHARNLYHASALMYDAWAIYDDTASSVFLGGASDLDACQFDLAKKQRMIAQSDNIEKDTETAISYGLYALLTRRFLNSPGTGRSQSEFVQMANAYNVDRDITLADSIEDSPQQLGLYLAACMKDYGEADGSNQQDDYANTVYQTVNPPLDPALPGNPTIEDSDRWQSLKLDIFIDQSGNPTDTPEFLGAEWGKVLPFALTEQDLTIYQRAGFDYWLYHDPGVPAYLIDTPALPEEYKWGHTLVALWSSHLDPSDGIMVDISPASIGNATQLPGSIEELRSFYRASSGGSSDAGRSMNPATNAPYQTQLVPRGDYTRVLAEFWADGPDSETPPGHWFTILNNAVSDHHLFEKRYQGQGVLLDNLEWDVKAYLVLGGAVHDAAISAWGVKGWYDYIRPISAIRNMAEFGQSTDTSQANYHPYGLPLVNDLIELVLTGDALAGASGQNLGEVKLYAWRGPDQINDPSVDTAGVGWILAKNWWPYQRPSFVTPPFAGYVSGHSTFSRAAAEVLTLLTGDEYFPGGMAEFVATKDEFLVFEKGPSVDVRLQWATFNDASDQSGLSRIWGGIHPPVDDVPGRRIGIEVGQDAFDLAQLYFNGEINVLPTPVEPPAPVVVIQAPSNSGGGSAFMLLLIMGVGLCLRKASKIESKRCA